MLSKEGDVSFKTYLNTNSAPANLLAKDRITEWQNKVVITDRMWARLLSSTNQPSFLGTDEVNEAKKEEAPPTQLLDGERTVKMTGMVTKDTKPEHLPLLTHRMSAMQ